MYSLLSIFIEKLTSFDSETRSVESLEVLQTLTFKSVIIPEPVKVDGF